MLGSNSQCGSEKGSLTKLVIGGSTEQGIAAAVGASTRLRLNLLWAIDVWETPILLGYRNRVNGVEAKRRCEWLAFGWSACGSWNARTAAHS